MVEQDPNEPDIQNSLYWSDDGAFDINSLTVFDTIGSGFLNTDGGNIIINTLLVVTSIPTNNQAIISAYDVTSNNIVGNFTINNLNPGIYITATSPGDNNNVTDGNYSVGVFENIFINPSYPTTIEFTSNINSELGDASIEMQYININCTNTIEENIVGNEIFPNPNNGIFFIRNEISSIFNLYNLKGKIIAEKELEIGINNLNFIIKPGAYIAEIKNSKNQKFQKIIIY